MWESHLWSYTALLPTSLVEVLSWGLAWLWVLHWPASSLCSSQIQGLVCFYPSSESTCPSAMSWMGWAVVLLCAQGAISWWELRDRACPQSACGLPEAMQHTVAVTAA